MKKRTALILAAVLAAIYPLAAQSLKPSAEAPKADGVVADGEYSFTEAYKDMTLHLSLSSDGKVLYVALAAPTSGWVAVGLGSLKMDGAFMVLGYDKAGKAEVSEETGKGRRHSPNSDRRLSSQAVREADGKTTLEFSLPASSHAAGASLRMILAYGRRDDFTSFHAQYAPAEISVTR